MIVVDKVTSGAGAMVIDWAIRDAAIKFQPSVHAFRKEVTIIFEVALSAYPDCEPVTENRAVEFINEAKEEFAKSLQEAERLAGFMRDVYGLVPRKEKEN